MGTETLEERNSAKASEGLKMLPGGAVGVSGTAPLPAGAEREDRGKLEGPVAGRIKSHPGPQGSNPGRLSAGLQVQSSAHHQKVCR